jgi:hypothetical protein
VAQALTTRSENLRNLQRNKMWGRLKTCGPIVNRPIGVARLAPALLPREAGNPTCTHSGRLARFRVALRAWYRQSVKRLTESEYEYIDEQPYGVDWFVRWNLGGIVSTSPARAKARGQANGHKVED